MPIPTKDEAQKILEPYHELIWRVVHEAWDEFMQVKAMRAEAGMAPLLYDRTAANEVFDAIARRAIPLFRAEPRVSVRVEAQTFKLIFASRLAARFKKGGDDKLGRNIQTQAALAFVEADGELPGLPPETAKVEFIWLPNDIWTKVAALLVIARDGDSLIWDYEIRKPGEAAEMIPFPTIDGGPDEPPADGGDLIKPKARPGSKPVGQ